ncbi:MAG: hypothetical protein K9I29_00870 [Bacteroidales bacterium]|nr:hypothetical protein [Bacteroidales bacterium]MCF8326819.1 hypothetical protein [Bacteroidales bacterium]
MGDKSIADSEGKKIIPEEIKHVALKALSFYPELNDIRIEFKFSEDIRKSVMQAQPKYVTMYKSRQKRTYLIKLSRYFIIKQQQIKIHELPNEVLIGWLGHELGHIIDYMKRNAWSMLLFGIGYSSSKSFIISAERTADTYAVNHGLGQYILKTKQFIMEKAGMPETYIQRMNRLYLPPEEIIDLMKDQKSED